MLLRSCHTLFCFGTSPLCTDSVFTSLLDWAHDFSQDNFSLSKIYIQIYNIFVLYLVAIKVFVIVITFRYLSFRVCVLFVSVYSPVVMLLLFSVLCFWNWLTSFFCYCPVFLLFARPLRLLLDDNREAFRKVVNIVIEKHYLHTHTRANLFKQDKELACAPVNWIQFNSFI